MGEVKFMGALVLILLFSIAVVGYAINFASDNDAVITLADDKEFSDLNTNVKDNITNFAGEDTDKSSKAFYESTVASGDETTVTGGQFKVGFGSLMKGLASTFRVIRLRIFGGNPALSIFITALSGFLVYVGIRYIWKTWKGGNPD